MCFHRKRPSPIVERPHDECQVCGVYTLPHLFAALISCRLSHEVHKAALNLHRDVKTYKKNMKKWRRAVGPKAAGSVSDDVVLEMDNFQDPQVSVLECLFIRRSHSFASIALQSPTLGIFSRLHLYLLVS